MAARLRKTAASVSERPHNLKQLGGGAFDLLVIGGGINGAGIARDAAMRGLRVALVEKGDFASGTSSKSSKLIHGGVRYLEHAEFRLVRIACRERDLLRRRLAPHLVEPLAFLFPVYRDDPVGFFKLGLGMWVYDLLAAFRNIRAHRMLSAKRVLDVEPGMRSEGLRGAALYYDCWTDDARLTLETVLAAREEGAIVANYVELMGFAKENGRITGALLRELVGGAQIAISADCVVNATGPWADHVRRLDDPAAKPCLRLTKGAHIVVPRERVGNRYAVVLRSPRDQRVLFVIPWESHSLIGTTDTDFDGSPDEVKADQSDIEYLLEAANWFFPRASLTPADIVSSFAGLRPLVRQENGGNPSAVSREEDIFESSSGLITLAGGKLTTYRHVAEEIVDRVAKRLGSAKAHAPCRTAQKPLPGGQIADSERIVQELYTKDGHGLSVQQLRRLTRRYGSRTAEVVNMLQMDADLSHSLVPAMPDIWAEAEYAAQREMALKPDDILLRRTNVGIKDPVSSAQIVENIIEILKAAGEEN